MTKDTKTTELAQTDLDKVTGGSHATGSEPAKAPKAGSLGTRGNRFHEDGTLYGVK